MFGVRMQKFKIALGVIFFIILEVDLKISLVLQRPYRRNSKFLTQILHFLYLFNFTGFRIIKLKFLFLEKMMEKVFVINQKIFFNILDYLQCSSSPFNLPSGSSNTIQVVHRQARFAGGWLDGWMDGQQIKRVL